jgi:hypothetical protein
MKSDEDAREQTKDVRNSVEGHKDIPGAYLLFFACYWSEREAYDIGTYIMVCGSLNKSFIPLIRGLQCDYK